MSVPDESPAARVTAGVDWAKDDHAVCVVGAEGEALHRFVIKHNQSGLKDMVRRLRRFPTQDSLACLAGVAPSTRQSGKVKAATFRWSANTQLRDALCDFAGDSRRDNIWAADLYAKAIARGHDHPHAVRILGRAWAHIIWRCWQTNTPYNPADHGALQRILNQDQKPAA